MAGKEDWGKPAAWAITQNEKLWTAFDSVADRSVIVEWSLGDTYRTKMMEAGDRAVFWVVGKNGGIARVGFVLTVRRTPKGYWKDALGTRHKRRIAANSSSLRCRTGDTSTEQRSQATPR